MNQQARDEAGNIWEVDPQGNPVRLLQPAAQAQAPSDGVILSSPDDPNEQRKAALEVQRLEKQLADMDKPDRGTIPTGYQMKADGTGIEPIPGYVPKDAKPDTKTLQRIANLDSLVQQINRTQQLFNAGPGSTSGIAAIGDYVPTQRNRQFDAAAAGLAEQGLAAFRVPGVGSQSDTELRQFVEANKPQASDFDSAAQEKLRQLRARVDATRAAMGLPSAQWEGAPQDDSKTVNFSPPGSGTTPPQDGGGGNGPDRSTRYFGNGTGPTGGDGLALSQDGTQAVPDPVGQAAAARLNTMLKGGAPDAEIANYAQQVQADPSSVSQALQFRRQNPGYAGDYSFSGFAEKSVPMPVGRQLLNYAAQSAPGAYVMNTANALTFNGLDNMAPNPELARAGMDAATAAHPGASTLGTISGGALAAGGLEAGAAGLATRFAPLLAGGRWIPRLADAVYGAGSGAGAADEGNRGTGALLGAATGAAGGMFGRSLTRGVANSASGIRNAAIDELRTRNIPLTVGQALSQSGRVGGVIKGVEDRLSGLPVIGDVVNARRNEGLRQFNRAAFDEALSPIGQTTAGNIGETGVQQAQDLVSGAYDNALGGAQATIDQPFVSRLSGVVTNAQAIPRVGGEVSDSLNAIIPPYFSPQGTLSGRNLQPALRDLKQFRAGYKNDPLGPRVGDVVRDAEGAMTGLFERQAPDVMPAYNRANDAYRRIAILQDAVGDSAKNADGIFTPAQLNMKAAQNTKRFGGKAANARGDRPFFNLTRAAQDVLPSKVPDSGTAGRLATLALPTALGAGGGYALDDTKSGIGTGLALGALLTAGGSRSGQRALTAALLDRPQTLRVIGDQIRRRAGVGGIFGASLSQLPTQALLPSY